ncbi:MAG TPA: DUF2306 domain-containing protein [Candidatus Binatia bacterium]|nr:DUF2306 domain-containing protein [Candidatus Binatia bacterium]
MEQPRSFTAKHAWLLVFAAMIVFVIYNRDWALLDENSPLRQRYAGIPWWMLVHGVTGAVALLLAPFQFSQRLRQRCLKLHRIMGRVYVACTAVAAPFSIPIAVILGPEILIPAATLQSLGWIATTATALYCIRTGRVEQHREWMLRSYPFGMVFVVVRVLVAIPAIDRMGELGLAMVVWPTIAVAGILPSFLLAWKHLAAGAPAVVTQRAA